MVWVPPGHGSLPAEVRGVGRFVVAAREVDAREVERLHLLARQQQVGQLEILAGVSPYESLPEVFRGAEVVHFVDNTSAIAGLVKGSSPQADSQAMIFAFHLREVELQMQVWFAYIESKANVADMPSRQAFSEMVAALRALRPEFGLEAASVVAEFPDVAPGWMARGVERVRAASVWQPRQRGSRGARRRRREE